MGCFGNPRFWVIATCYYLYCPHPRACKEKRKENRESERFNSEL